MSLHYADRTETVRDALERAIASLTRPTVTLRELLAIIGDHGPLLLCALLSIPFLIPVSIPGVSTIFGLAILLLAIGITLNRTPWLPARVMDRAVDAQKLKGVLERGVKLILRIEAVISRRIEVLTAGSFAGRVNGLAIVAGALLLMLPLGLVPFSNTLPAFAILFLSIGMSQRDGFLVLAGYAALAATCVYFTILVYAAYAAGNGLLSIFAE
jgi:hypothetical protein